MSVPMGMLVFWRQAIWPASLPHVITDKAVHDSLDFLGAAKNLKIEVNHGERRSVSAKGFTCDGPKGGRGREQ